MKDLQNRYESYSVMQDFIGSWVHVPITTAEKPVGEKFDQGY